MATHIVKSHSSCVFGGIIPKFHHFFNRKWIKYNIIIYATNQGSSVIQFTDSYISLPNLTSMSSIIII